MITRLVLRHWYSVKHLLFRRGWIERHVGGESRDVWKIGPFCVKRWQESVRANEIRVRCRLAREFEDFVASWYLPWLHWSVGLWVRGRRADHQTCQKLAWKYPWTKDIAPQNVVGRDGARIVDFQLMDAIGLVRKSKWFKRHPGGGESLGIWRIGPVCVKRWRTKIEPVDVWRRCQVSRQIAVCNSMWYVPWLHWTISRWRFGPQATHAECNRLLAENPGIGDLHPGNVVLKGVGVWVVNFGVRPCRKGLLPDHPTTSENG